MYDPQGNTTWEVEYDIYGKIRKQLKGKAGDCPFRYQGQYEDKETGLYYNRFRYYSADEGVYLSQDPIGLHSGEMNIYSYVNDSNYLIDPFGLAGFTPDQQALIDLANETSNKGRTAISGNDADILLDFATEVNSGASQQVKVLDHRFSSGANPSPGHFAHEGADGHIHIHNKHIPCS